MEKKYIVEFEELNGNKFEFEFITRDIEWSVEQFCRNRRVRFYRILKESAVPKKRMLFD